MIALAADIGGTYSRLAWSGSGTTAGENEQSFNNAEFDGLEAVIDRGLSKLGSSGKPIDRMVLAVPGPVHDDPIRLTNINWQLRRDSLKTRFQTSQLKIVNDFQAAALGAINEPFERLKILNAGIPQEGPVVVAGAGTGLGMAWLPTRDDERLPQATEGGHLDFAPNNAAQLAVYRQLAERYGHVSYERVLSGNGLLNGYRDLAGSSAQASSPAAVVDAAKQGDRVAVEAVQQFIDVFAAYAGNLALAFNPTGGIYLCGGLAVHLADWFDPTAFALAFTAKGRMSEVVRRIPAYLVTRHDAGLAGASRILQSLHRAET
ncbi:MAG: ROK family protein [Sedimenticolaceae bacterium]